VRLFSKKHFFTPQENEQILMAIREAEEMTSGEIRLFVEHRCRFMDPMDRAMEVFAKLKMQHTALRNGVLLYVALKDRQFAILGDEGIHRMVGDDYWKRQAAELKNCFREGRMTEGMARCIREIGQSLKQYFPHRPDDENELPDGIVFGK
jgi:uncharacterized membrane protein